MKLTTFQQRMIRRLGALRASLHDRTLGLSRGQSKRRAEDLPEAHRERTKAERQLAEAEHYASETRDDQFRANDLPRFRDRAEAARSAVALIEAELVELDKQHEAANADSNQSGKVFEAVLKAADAKKSQQAPAVPRARDVAQLGREMNAQASAGGEQTMLEREVEVVETSMRTRRR